VAQKGVGVTHPSVSSISKGLESPESKHLGLCWRCPLYPYLCKKSTPQPPFHTSSGCATLCRKGFTEKGSMEGTLWAGFFLCFFLGGGGSWGLDSGFQTCYAGTLPLESFFLLFLRKGFALCPGQPRPRSSYFLVYRLPVAIAAMTWAHHQIQFSAEMGVSAGYPRTTFLPNSASHVVGMTDACHCAQLSVEMGSYKIFA
jgi:hypothetical protein